MVKSVKELPFLLTQKISEQDSIVWLKNSNKYIILNSKILELIKDKLSLSSKDFLLEITESLNVSSSIAKKIDKDIIRKYVINNESIPSTVLNKYIDILENELGVKAIRELVDIQPGDVKDTYANVTSLVKDFNYQPKTTIEDGISRFVKWYKDYYIK